LIRESRRRGPIKIGFDVDDLVFEPSEVVYTDGYQCLSVDEQELYELGVLRYQELMRHVDFVSVSTLPLAQHAVRYCSKVVVIPNLISRGMWNTRFPAKEAATFPSIGYFSGTRSHEKDFAMIEPVLVDLLMQNREMVLHLGGALDKRPWFANYPGRVLIHHNVSMGKLPRLIRSSDINLCPLERSPFCDAKSPVKFLEASLAGIPSIVSANPAYECVVDGKTGLVADGVDQWRDKLNLLISDSSLRKSLIDESQTMLRNCYITESEPARASVAAYVEYLKEE